VNKLLVCGSLLWLACGAAGCGASKTRDSNELKQIGLAVQTSYSRGAAATKPEDLEPSLKDVPETYRHLKEGKFVVAWPTPGIAPQEIVLAYAAEVPQQGGLVLLLGPKKGEQLGPQEITYRELNVREMSAQEFESAKRASDKP
jgi:hypothetical protein